MTHETTDVETMVDVMSRMLGFDLNEESRSAVVMHLDIAFNMAPLFLDFQLDDEAEPAPVYAP